MKFIARLFFLFLLTVIVGTVVGVFLMIEDEPLIASARDLTVNDLRRARVFMENSDPRNLAPGEISAFTVDEADLELLVNIDSCSMRSVCRKRPDSLLVVAHF